MCVCVTHYAAESLSWYSRERLKQACTPLSFHRRLMTPASSAVMKPSSADPASTNSCLASSCERAVRQHNHHYYHQIVTISSTVKIIPTINSIINTAMASSALGM